MVQIIECPRDAMQGMKRFIPTSVKIDYINDLLKVGFDSIDFGSFVSPKAIPQMADTVDVLEGLDLDNTKSRLLAIVANERGAREAAAFEAIHFLGYPFSISEEFQKRNTNATIEESMGRVESIAEIAAKNQKEVVIYISMAFGNPYGEKWHPDIAIAWVKRIYDAFGIKTIALSDTVGTSNPTVITSLFEALIPALPLVNFGAHLHTTPDTSREKIEAAYQAGCRRFDGAIKGFGGCPMAADELTGNMPTESMLSYFDENQIDTGLDMQLFGKAMEKAEVVF